MVGRGMGVSVSENAGVREGVQVVVAGVSSGEDLVGSTAVGLKTGTT